MRDLRRAGRIGAILGGLLCAHSTAWTDEVRWDLASGAEAVQLVELYTSQGCSSCPPAERFLTELSRSPDLWTRYVPVSFHVTYWDRLGWADLYGRPEFTERQQRSARALGLPSAYTPGFIVDGREWRGFFSGQALPKPRVGRSAGQLRARLDAGEVVLELRPDDASPQSEVSLHVALLGVGLCDSIAAGENRGKEIRQDFVVLGYASGKAQPARDESVLTGRMALPRWTGAAPDRYALAVWATDADKLEPLQAAGGWIELDGRTEDRAGDVPSGSSGPCSASPAS